ncbi:MAG: universal stress protein [Acidobacteriota bacterium]
MQRRAEPRVQELVGSVLVGLGAPEASRAVLGRVTMLPLRDDVRVVLAHVVSRLRLTAARERLQARARDVAHAAALDLSRRLPPGARIEVIVDSGSVASVLARTAGTAEADLVVLGASGSTEEIAETLLGSTAERVVRRGSIPALVVRLEPRAPYRKPLLAVTLDSLTVEALPLMLRLLPRPRPRVTVVHAWEPWFDLLGQPFFSAEERRRYRNEDRNVLQRRLARRLTNQLIALRPLGDDVSWSSLVRFGAARTVVGEVARAMRADLLVLGTHGRTGLAYAFRGTVGGELLRDVGCDVLLVPRTATDLPSGP